MLVDNLDHVVKVSGQLGHINAKFDKCFAFAFAHTLVRLVVHRDGFLDENIIQDFANLLRVTWVREFIKTYASFRVKRTVFHTFFKNHVI